MGISSIEFMTELKNNKNTSLNMIIQPNAIVVLLQKESQLYDCQNHSYNYLSGYTVDLGIGGALFGNVNTQD